MGSSVDEYLAGRGDRLGSDLLLDLRGQSGESELVGAVVVGQEDELRAVVGLLREREPDLVWMLCPAHVGDGKGPESSSSAFGRRLHVLARLAHDAGAQVLLLFEDDEALEALVAREPRR